jgi:hypothetical protein
MMMMMISSVVLSMLNPPSASVSERHPVKGSQHALRQRCIPISFVRQHGTMLHTLKPWNYVRFWSAAETHGRVASADNDGNDASS